MSLPWSAKDEKSTLDDTDEIMLFDPTEPLAVDQNKRITTTNVKFTLQPKPVRHLDVTTEQDLIDKFGADIEVPNGQSFLLSINEDFTLTKPIKLGLGSAVRFEGAVSSINVTYTGTGAMFQNTDPADLIDSFDIKFVQITGDTTNTAFDLRGTSFFLMNTVQIVQFDSIGFLATNTIVIRNVGLFANNIGLTIQDPIAVSIKVILIDQTGAGDTGMTAFSIIQANSTLVILDDVRATSFSAGESMLFFDPNAPVGAAFIITNATKVAGNLFQPGTDIAATAAAASGGDTQFDITAHGLVVGQVIVLKDFDPEPYDGTFRVTAVNDANSVDINVAFTSSDTGTMSAKSLDSTDVLVSAFNNPGEPDSMFTAESGFEDAAASSTTINTVDVPEVIVNGNYGFASLERFAEGTTNEGEIVTLDTATRRYAVAYGGSLNKTTGGSIIMGVVLLKNGSLVGFNPPRSPSVTSAQVGGVNIIELSENDTLQVGVINYTDDSDITITHVDLVVNRA